MDLSTEQLNLALPRPIQHEQEVSYSSKNILIYHCVYK